MNTDRLFGYAANVAIAEAERLRGETTHYHADPATERTASPAALGNRVQGHSDLPPVNDTLRVPFCSHKLAGELEDLDDEQVLVSNLLDVSGHLTAAGDRVMSAIAACIRLSGSSTEKHVRASALLLDVINDNASELLTALDDAGELSGSAQRAQEADAERQEQELTKEDVREWT